MRKPFSPLGSLSISSSYFIYTTGSSELPLPLDTLELGKDIAWYRRQEKIYRLVVNHWLPIFSSVMDRWLNSISHVLIDFTFYPPLLSLNTQLWKKEANKVRKEFEETSLNISIQSKDTRKPEQVCCFLSKHTVEENQSKNSLWRLNDLA